MAKRSPTPVRARLRPRLPGDLAGVGPVSDDELDLEGVAWSDADVPHHLESLVIRECRLRDVRFTGCRVARLDACDVVFEDCELSGAFISAAQLDRVEFHRCRMSGIDLSRATAQDVLFEDCRLDDANLRAATLLSVDIEGCGLRNADFYAARIERSNVLRSDLTDADFSKCRLDRVLLHGSTLVDVKGAAALAGAIISRDQAMTLAPAVITAIGITVDDDFHDAATPD